MSAQSKDTNTQQMIAMEGGWLAKGKGFTVIDSLNAPITVTKPALPKLFNPPVDSVSGVSKQENNTQPPQSNK